MEFNSAFKGLNLFAIERSETVKTADVRGPKTEYGDEFHRALNGEILAGIPSAKYFCC